MSKVSWSVLGLGMLVGAQLAAGSRAFAEQKGGAPTAQMQKVLDAHEALGGKPLHTLTPAEARKGVTAKDAAEKVLNDAGKPVAPEPVAKVQDTTIPGAAGQIAARVYTPEGAGPFPVIVYFHGGGFVVANLDVYDATPRALANQAKAVVVSVHYRQTPEHPAPAAADDATAAFRHLVQNAASLNGDPARVAVAGESAGGNLATVVAMRQRRDDGVMPVYQLLVYPFVDNRLNSPSHRQNGTGNYLVSNEDLGWFWSHYLGPDWKEVKRPDAVPTYATTKDLRGLPAAMVITADLDPLRDEGRRYAAQLRSAGVRVDLKNYPGVTHEFFGMAAVVDTAKRAQADAGAALRKAFGAKKHEAKLVQ